MEYTNTNTNIETNDKSAEDIERERLLDEMTEAIPFQQNGGVDRADVEVYVSDTTERGEVVDYSTLDSYIFDARMQAWPINGDTTRFDPVDDQEFIPEKGQFVQYLTDEQINTNAEAIIAAGGDIDYVTSVLSPERLKELKPILVELNASKLRINTQLAKASLKGLFQ